MRLDRRAVLHALLPCSRARRGARAQLGASDHRAEPLLHARSLLRRDVPAPTRELHGEVTALPRLARVGRATRRRLPGASRPSRRGGDRRRRSRSSRAAGVVVIYPEGGRSRSEHIGERARPGVGRLALESGAPVVPGRDPRLAARTQLAAARVPARHASATASPFATQRQRSLRDEHARAAAGRRRRRARRACAGCGRASSSRAPRRPLGGPRLLGFRGAAIRARRQYGCPRWCRGFRDWSVFVIAVRAIRARAVTGRAALSRGTGAASSRSDCAPALSIRLTCGTTERSNEPTASL